MSAQQTVANFLAFHQHAVLSTQSARYHGYPFGSLVPYDISRDGSFVIYISRIAEHFKNLTTHPHASLTVTDPFAFVDPQAAMRVCVMLDLTPVPETERRAVEEGYVARFPRSVRHELAHDFLFFSGCPKHIRWIAGFGQMGWISPDANHSLIADPITYNGWQIAEHMNSDHREALQEIALASGKRFAPHELCMDMVSSHGFSIRILATGETMEIPFARVAKNVDDVRRLVIDALKEAKQKLLQ